MIVKMLTTAKFARYFKVCNKKLFYFEWIKRMIGAFLTSLMLFYIFKLPDCRFTITKTGNALFEK